MSLFIPLSANTGVSESMRIIYSTGFLQVEKAKVFLGYHLAEITWINSVFREFHMHYENKQKDS